MGFYTGAVMNVWEIKHRADKYTDIKASHAKRQRKDGKYVTDFIGHLRLFGQAHEANLQIGQRFKLIKCDVVSKSEYNGWQDVRYYNFLVNEIEIIEDKNGKNDDTPI